jgi:U3 small nucleolar RNA-associated protein 3
VSICTEPNCWTLLDCQVSSSTGESEPEKDKAVEEEEGKRGITYQIAKNKGLTPHRKKEQRNPRVKHRNKYRRARICRKGQVRWVFIIKLIIYVSTTFFINT